MAHILIMPRQGNTVESCIITEWKVKEGDNVTARTNICEVETDKASFEIPAGSAGIVLKLLFNEGDDVPVLSPIAVIGSQDEDWRAALEETASEDTFAGSGPVQEKTTKSEKENNDKFHGFPRPASHSPSDSDASLHAAVSPRARNLADKESLPLGSVSGTGPRGRIIERDVLAALEKRPALTLAAKAKYKEAIARNAAGEHQFDYLPYEGSGLNGRVTIDDLAAMPAGFDSSRHARHSSLRAQPVSFPADGLITETQIKGVRGIISEKMRKSLAETAQFTLNASAPASKLQDVRSLMNENGFFQDDISQPKITINDLILLAVSRVLPSFSFMNAHKTGDIIKTFERVHIGVAVDTPRGLMVPVIRNCDKLSLSEISSETKRLASSCRSGTVRPEELSGSTFSVTNLGAFGITGFTPVLNTPEVAILGVCGIEIKPTVSKSGNHCVCGFSFMPHIALSLTINHQVVDGAPAARFLKALCETIENIDTLLSVEKAGS